MGTSAVELSNAIAQIVERGSAGVVRIEGQRGRGASGTLWSEQGVVVTASHVLEREETVNVVLPDGASHIASVLGRDPGTDLAVLRVDAAGLVPPTWAETNGLEVGNFAVALARPGKTVRAALGIVSVLSESFRGPLGSKIDRYVQIDRDLPAGFSGGPSLDLHGHVLGVSTSGLVRGANLVVPTVTVRRIVEQLLAHGRVRKGYLGVGVYPVRLQPEIAKQQGQQTGALLVAIEPGGPADNAGLLQGDVLLSIDGQSVESPYELAAVLEDRADSEAIVRVVRAGQIHQATVTPAQQS
jgi:serine protease DegQ